MYLPDDVRRWRSWTFSVASIPFSEKLAPAARLFFLACDLLATLAVRF